MKFYTGQKVTDRILNDALGTVIKGRIKERTIDGCYIVNYGCVNIWYNSQGLLAVKGGFGIKNTHDTTEDYVRTNTLGMKIREKTRERLKKL